MGQPNGPSLTIIKNYVKENLPTDIEWNIPTVLRELRNMMKDGDLRQLRTNYKVSEDYKEKVKKSTK